MTDVTNKSDNQLIAIVRKGQQAFFEMANAIYEIDKREIWKKSATSMAEFCEIEFGMSPTDISRYKGASRVLKNLSEFSILPTNEGQARELVRLRHADPQQKVWRAVLKRVEYSSEAITARLIRETAKAVLDDEDESQPEPEIVVTGVGQLVQIVQALSELTISMDEQSAALEQLELIQKVVDGLRVQLAA